MKHSVSFDTRELSDLSLAVYLQRESSKERLKTASDDDFRQMLTEEVIRLTALHSKIEAALKELPS